MGVVNSKKILVFVLFLILLIPISKDARSNDDNEKAEFETDDSVNFTSNSRSHSNRNQIRSDWTIISHNNNGQNEVNPKIVSFNNNLHVVWREAGDGPAFYDAVEYRRSMDAGLTWDNIITFDSGMDYAFNIPDISINQPNVHTIWYRNDDTGSLNGIYHSSSVNNGKDWSNKALLINESYSNCAIGINGSTLFLLLCPWDVNDLYLIKSIDNGKNWENKTRLTFNENVTLYDDYFWDNIPRIVVVNDTIHIFWVDKRDGNPEIYYKKSINAGSTWTNDIRLTHDSSKSENPAVVVNDNNIFLAWMDDRDGNFEIYFKKSIDNGNSWSNDIRLTFNESLSKQPAIAVSSNNVHVVWSDNRVGYWSYGNYYNYCDIFYKYSTDGGIHWSNDINFNVSYYSGTRLGGHDPSIAINEKNLYLVWEVDQGIWDSVIGFKHYPFSPRVIVNPINNSLNVPISTNITMMFNQPMNHNSVENAFVLSPIVKGSFKWEDNSCIFFPSSNLDPNTTYIVKIEGTACNKSSALLDGNSNGISEDSPIDDFIWSFSTGNSINLDKTPPNIVSINLPNNTQNVTINSSIQIVFNESMNKKASESAFSIYPEISGLFNWDNYDKIMNFIPYSNLNYSTTYNITISASAKDIVGNTLDGNKNGIAEGSATDDYRWSFTTEKYVPICYLLAPSYDDMVATPTPTLMWELGIGFPNMVNVYYDVYLDTNRSNVESLNKSARLAFNLTETNYTAITPFETEYYWTVIPHRNESFGYCQSGIFKFFMVISNVSRLPFITSTIPKNNSTNVEINTTIEIIFSFRMNQSSVENAFSIKPYINGSFYWSNYNRTMRFYPERFLAFNQTYNLKISTSAKSIMGSPFDGNMNNKVDGSPVDDYYWSFTTAPAENVNPIIQINNPLNNSVFNFNDTIYFDCFNSTDPDGDLLGFLWVSNITGILSSNPQFSINLPIGQHQITLFVNDSQGHNISESIIISITPWNRPPIAVITLPFEGAVFNITDSIRFDGSDSYDLDLDTLDFYWHSNISGGFGYKSPFTTKLPESLHLVTLYVNDGFYHNVSVIVNITVIDPSISPGGGNGPTKPPPPTQDDSFYSTYGLYVGIVLIIIIVIIFGFAAATEVGKYGILGTMVPLYRKLKGKQVLDNETRGMIRGYILANPGEHYSIIKRTLGLKNGTLTYHLKVLEEEGLVKSERDGIFKRFFPIEERVPENIMHISKVQELILNEIISKPGITSTELSKKTDKSHQIINYHLKKLINAELIRVERLGKKNKYYPVE
jgi:DNA-binding transcriptional ArsR family regulator